MSDTGELRAPGGGRETTGPGYGAALMARLNTAAAEVSGLLTRLGNVRPGPPITSMDRRRLADQAERSTAALDDVCQDLDAWIAERDDEVRVDVPAGVEAGKQEKPEAETATATLSDVSSAQEALDQARVHLHGAVDGARADGASWRQIGEALGIAAQTAHKRFDPRARQRHADYMRTRYQRLSSR